jgi:hypothetical protein
VIEALLLKARAVPSQGNIQMSPKKASCTPLIAVFDNSNPQQMQMIWHATIQRTTQSMPKGRVRKEFAKLMM